MPRALAGTAIPFPYGDLAALGQLLDDHRGEVAAVIMEPLRSQEPPEGYLAAVGKLVREHDAVFIFDEVSTGFRLSTGGVQPAGRDARHGGVRQVAFPMAIRWAPSWASGR